MAINGFRADGEVYRYNASALEGDVAIPDGSVTLDSLASGVIDDTLAVDGAAADAKATGDAITALNDRYTNLHFADLLWSNPNQAQAFSSQVVYLNTSKYDFFLLVYRNSTDREVLETEIAIKGFRLHHASALYRGNTKYLLSRTITVNEGSINFWNGTISTTALVESNDDSVLVPEKVYGIGVVKS